MPLEVCALMLWFGVARGNGDDELPVAVEVFRDGLEEDTVPSWHPNSCESSIETDTVHEGDACLKLVDRGGNAQVFMPLATVPGLRYGVSVYGFRRASNAGTWLGCAAVSFDGGRGNSAA